MFLFVHEREHAISPPGEHINPRNDDAKVQQRGENINIIGVGCTIHYTIDMIHYIIRIIHYNYSFECAQKKPHKKLVKLYNIRERIRRFVPR